MYYTKSSFSPIHTADLNKVKCKWCSFLNSVSSNTSPAPTPDLQLQEKESASKPSIPSSWSWVLMHLPKVSISLSPCGNTMRNTDTKLLNQIQHKSVYVGNVFYRQFEFDTQPQMSTFASLLCPPTHSHLDEEGESLFPYSMLHGMISKYFIFLSLPQMCLGHVLPSHRTFPFAAPFQK